MTGQSRWCRKKNGKSHSKLDSAHIVLKQLEDFLGESKDDVVKNSRELTSVVSNYLKEHPLMSTGSALVLGAVLTFLLIKSQESGHEDEEEEDDDGDSEHVTSFEGLLNHMTSEVKKHSFEVCDAAIANFVKKKPLHATGAALAAGLVISLLSRNNHK